MSGAGTVRFSSSTLFCNLVHFKFEFSAGSSRFANSVRPGVRPPPIKEHTAVEVFPVRFSFCFLEHLVCSFNAPVNKNFEEEIALKAISSNSFLDTHAQTDEEKE